MRKVYREAMPLDRESERARQLAEAVTWGIYIASPLGKIPQRARRRRRGVGDRKQ